MQHTATVHPGRSAHVRRLLDAAKATLDDIAWCWVVTPADDGGANARIVREAPMIDGEDPWTRWFVSNRTARKIAEIRASGRVTLAYQHNAGTAYVTLAGAAELIDDPAVVKTRLRPVDDPDGVHAPKLLAVRVRAERIDVHVRGVTAEPWGHGRTTLQRGPDGDWRLQP